YALRLGASPNQPSRLLTTNSCTRLLTLSPNVCHSNLAPWVRIPALELTTLTSLELGYHSGRFAALTRCDQTTEHGADTPISLCANRSASAGVNAGGQWISEDRAARSRSTCVGVAFWAEVGLAQTPNRRLAATRCPLEARLNFNLTDMNVSHH